MKKKIFIASCGTLLLLSTFFASSVFSNTGEETRHKKSTVTILGQTIVICAGEGGTCTRPATDLIDIK